jgi:hypothetical protein
MYWAHTEHVTKGKRENVGRQGRKCKQLQDDLKEERRYWNLEKET